MLSLIQNVRNPAMERIKVILGLVLLIFFANKIANAAKLNYPRVLLPIFDKISINFTLEVIEKGCFRWSSSRQDLILITPLYEDLEGECAYRALITVLTRERKRNTAIVLADDTSSGELLRCDVILDIIDRLGVHTTTRQLFLEEAPETFELRAEDSQGNAFTTLEGIEFNWAISSVSRGTKGWSPALRFLTFTESPYHEVPPSLEKFEAQRIKGYMVLLEGINTGTAKVTVSLPYPEYARVSSIEVYINVLANIILEPSEVHMIAGDTINFRILQLKQGKLQEISLNDQYFLEIEHTHVASIQHTSVTGLTLGRTAVALRDRNVPTTGVFESDNAVMKSSVPSAQITVCAPTRLGMTLLPHNNWVTVEGERHEIALDLYTDDQKITLGSRFSMSAELDEMMFYIMKRNSNNTRLYGAAVKPGRTLVYGSFKDLSAQAEIQIFSKLSLSPRKVILPYDPNILQTQRIQFVAAGGDGSYVWSSQNPRAVQVNQNGLATTVIRDSDGRSLDSFETGGSLLAVHANIRVALARNHKIQRQAEIFFLPPAKLEIVKYNFETALRDYVRLHVAVYTYENETYVPFTGCENLHFDLEFSNQIFQLDNSNPLAEEKMHQGACQVLQLRSTAVGLTNLRLSYKFMGKQLKDEATLYVFDKLSIHNPVENEVVLPVGSSRNVIFANGPQRIFTLEADLTKSTKYNSKVADVSEVAVDSQNNVYAFTVLCRKVGDTVLNFNVYNALNTPKFEAYVSGAMTKVYCVKPRFLNLYAVEQLRKSCPMEMRNSLMHIKDRDDKFEIEIEVLDAMNRKLMNISSLFIEWEFTAGDERYSSDAIRHHRIAEVELVKGIGVPGKNVLISTIAGVTNNFRIKGIVARYDSVVLRKQGIKAETPHFAIENPKTGEVFTPTIENEIRFMAVNSTLFLTDHISIFMAKNRRERIPIAQGSGFYDFQLTEIGVIDVEIDTKERELIVTPLRIGHVRIELTDRCLMTEPAQLSVSVVSIGAIRVESPDRVERTKSIEAIIRLYDSNDNVLHIDPFNLQIYDFTEDIFNSNILSLKLGDQLGLEEGEIRYIITGNNLGETKIVFNSGCVDNMVSSEPVHIQVFPPLRLYPRNSTLVVGSNVQISYHGGPQPDVNIVYSVHDKKIISMESAIITALKLGDTKITGKCIMKTPGSGKEVVMSEDTVEVHVVPLLSTQIRTPLIRIRSGAVMPAAVWGVPEISPMVLGTLENMRVVWSTNQRDVVDIYNIFADAGIEYSDKDLISVRIKALNPGKAKIQATIILAEGQKITTSVEVVVFKILELESPKRITMDWILVAPRSTIQLKANLDDAVYKPDADNNGIVRVSPDGVVRTHDTLGRDLLIAKTFEQTLPIGIEVKSVQYILASLVYPTLKLKQTEEKIPRGMNFVLKVSLHDNLGNEFSHNIEDVNAVKYELSHKDIVDVLIGNNLTVAINLPRETSNMIAISLRDKTGVKHAEDYIKLSVAESKHFYPTKTIFSVGDIICFDSPLTLSSTWTSSDEQRVSIDKHSGVAKILGSRFKLGEKVVVTNGEKAGGSFLKYDVEVRDADVVQFLKSFDIFSGNTYRAHLVLRNHLQVDKLTNLIAQNISKCSSQLEGMPVKLFTCRLSSKLPLGVQVLQHYKVTPTFEVDSGRYACQIVLTSSFNDVLNLIKTDVVHFELEVELPNGLSDSLSLKFVPGISVAPESIYMNELREQQLTVTGLDKVLQKIEVKPSDPAFLDVALQTKAHGSLQYRVQLKKNLPVDEQLFIYLHSETTLQNIEIPILGSNALQLKCSTQPFQSSSFVSRLLSNVAMVVSVLAVLVASVLLFLYTFTNPEPKDINSSAFYKPDTSRSTSLDDETSPLRSNTLSGSPLSGSPLNSTLYPNLSRYYGSRCLGDEDSFLPPQEDSQVYGDISIPTPLRRSTRRR